MIYKYKVGDIVKVNCPSSSVYHNKIGTICAIAETYTQYPTYRLTFEGSVDTPIAGEVYLLPISTGPIQLSLPI